MKTEATRSGIHSGGGFQATGERLEPKRGDELVAGELDELKQQVVDLQRAAAAAHTSKNFAEYSPEERVAMRGKLEDLARNGRLFRQTEPNGPLLKAEPSDAYHALESHLGMAWVVDRAGTLNEQTDSSRRDDGWLHASQSSSSEHKVSANYVSSPLLGWPDLEFVTVGSRGIPEVTKLPAPEGTALTGLSSFDQSSFWRATSWRYYFFSGEVVPTSSVAGSDSHSVKWNMG